MGRYLLIEFDENEAALKLKKQIDAATRGGKSFRVVGYFASPPAPFCQCPIEQWTKEKGRPYAPSKFMKKTGWRKCLKCNLYRDFDDRLHNQLKPEKIIKPRMRDHVAAIKNLGHWVNSISSSSQQYKEQQ